MGYHNFEIDLDEDIREDLAESLSDGDIPDWFVDAGLPGKEMDEVVERARQPTTEIGLVRFRIGERVPGAVQEAIDEWEEPEAKVLENEGVFFKGYQMLVEFDGEDVEEIRLVAAYQD